MSDIENLWKEYINAKEQLKSINVTINRDRKIVEDLDNEIKDKENKILSLNNEIEAKQWELDNFGAMVEDVEKSYGEVRDGLKDEIKKLWEKKKNEEMKYKVGIEELKNDINVLTWKRDELKKEIDDMWVEKRENIKNMDMELSSKEDEINKIEWKINDKLVKLEWIENKYNEKNKEVKEMEKRLKDKEKLEEDIEWLEKLILEKWWVLKWLNEEIENIKKLMNSMIEEKEWVEKEKKKAEKEVEWYVKMKMDLKIRKDNLDLREKAIRKKYEEAWLKYE